MERPTRTQIHRDSIDDMDYFQSHHCEWYRPTRIDRYRGKSTQLARAAAEKEIAMPMELGPDTGLSVLITKLFPPVDIGYVSISTGNFIIKSLSFFDSIDVIE